MIADRGIIILVLSCSVITACEEDKCCSCLEAEGKTDKYVYPIVPGSPEWSALQSGEEMYNACQIPNDILVEMCAVGLVDSWLTYPLRSNIFAFVNPQIGFEKITENFNGLPHLLSAPTTSEVLIKNYQAYNPSGYGANATNVEKGRHAVDLFVLELTLSQSQIIDDLSEAQRIDLVKEALSKRSLKLEDTVYHSDSDRDVLYHSSDVYIMAHCMIRSNYEPFMTELGKDNDALEHFIETCEYIYTAGPTTPAENLMIIVGHAHEFVAD